MIKEKFKKYRAVFVVALGMIFNLVESIMFAKSGNPFNLKPLSIGEWVCDIISILVILFGVMLASYDTWTYKPKKTTTYKRVNGEIVEIVVEE